MNVLQLAHASCQAGVNPSALVSMPQDGSTSLSMLLCLHNNKPHGTATQKVMLDTFVTDY